LGRRRAKYKSRHNGIYVQGSWTPRTKGGGRILIVFVAILIVSRVKLHILHTGEMTDKLRRAKILWVTPLCGSNNIPHTLGRFSFIFG
jgi:hypothetical protein